jgi:extracellular factor (EF) 3-hydroxypalmitic acid methyl ester biosynthesis protein
LTPQQQIDPVVSFRNTQGEAVRGTIINLQRKSLVMEIYNPTAIMQVSEVLKDLSLRLGTRSAYLGKAVVISMVNTGLTALVSATLIDEWRELSAEHLLPGAVGIETHAFVRNWSERLRVRPAYQILVNDMRSYLSDVARWVEQVDMSDSLPKVDGRLRADFLDELSAPLIAKAKSFMDALEEEAARIDPEHDSAHRAFAQAALHPLLLRAPFVFRTFTKPLGYAGDYEMVNQMLEDPRQGANTYFQIVNTAFWQAAAATAHRNRIDILVAYLGRLADAARAAGRPYRVLNVGCGPAMEIQRFLASHPEPHWLAFELVDFSEETLAYTRGKLGSIAASAGKALDIVYTQDSVNQLLKRRGPGAPAQSDQFDAVYCAGLFDYLSDKVCTRLMQHFAVRMRSGASMLVTNVHVCNPEKLFVMGHLLEWYLIYRDEARMNQLLPPQCAERKIYVDATGVNVFAEMHLS